MLSYRDEKHSADKRTPPRLSQPQPSGRLAAARPPRRAPSPACLRPLSLWQPRHLGGRRAGPSPAQPSRAQLARRRSAGGAGLGSGGSGSAGEDGRVPDGRGGNGTGDRASAASRLASPVRAGGGSRAVSVRVPPLGVPRRPPPGWGRVSRHRRRAGPAFVLPPRSRPWSGCSLGSSALPSTPAGSSGTRREGCLVPGCPAGGAGAAGGAGPVLFGPGQNPSELFVCGKRSPGLGSAC